MQSPETGVLDALRAYAAVSDAGQDHLLSMALRRAFSMVQSYSDRALLGGHYRLMADNHDGMIRIYMGGIVTNVVDASGASVQFQQCGDYVYVSSDNYVEVSFRTEPRQADYDMLLPVVLSRTVKVVLGSVPRAVFTTLEVVLSFSLGLLVTVPMLKVWVTGVLYSFSHTSRVT